MRNLTIAAGLALAGCGTAPPIRWTCTDHESGTTFTFVDRDLRMTNDGREFVVQDDHGIFRIFRWPNRRMSCSGVYGR